MPIRLTLGKTSLTNSSRFGGQLLGRTGQSGDVSTRACQAGDQPVADRIDRDRNDDGNRRRGVLGRLGSRRTRREDQVDLQINQFGREGWEASRLAFGGPQLDQEVLSQHIAEVPHRLHERVELHESEATTRRRLGGEKSKSGDPCPRLRLGGERCGEETNGDAGDECPPIHHSIT
jgi:hypothetical protein